MAFWEFWEQKASDVPTVREYTCMQGMYMCSNKFAESCALDVCVRITLCAKSFELCMNWACIENLCYMYTCIVVSHKHITCELSMYCMCYPPTPV